MRKRLAIAGFILLLAAAGIFWAIAKREALAKVNLSLREWWYENSPFAAPLPEISPDILTAERREHDAQIRQLNLRLIQKDAEIFELEHALGEFENFRRALPNLKSVATPIIGRSFFSDEIIVAAGAETGVETGWAAAQGLAIAGVVGMASDRASYVLLASNSGCVIPARAERSREICLVRGVGNERAVATFYAGQSAVAPGERLLTSGILGKIPAGLVVGAVETFPLRGQQAGTMEAGVKLAANFSALEHLLLIAPISPPPTVPSGDRPKPR